MELTPKDEWEGFAPSKHICPYHTWKPTGIVASCTCSPTPDHQISWEEKVFESSEDGALHQAALRFDSSISRFFLSGIHRKSMVSSSRVSRMTRASLLKAARNGFAARFGRVYKDTRSRKSCAPEVQETGGPECRI
jgi:hypothetical protein